MNNQGTMTAPKETNKTWMSYSKETEVYELCQRSHNNLKEIQWTTKNKMRSSNKEIETIKKKTEILELKNTVTELKILIELQL